MELNAAYYQQQIRFARGMCKRLWQDIPENQWHETPAGLDTNLTWQVGHLLISQYFAPVVTVFGSQADIKEQLPIKEYAMLFGLGSDPSQSQQFSRSRETLLADLDLVEARTLALLDDYDFTKLGEEPLRAHPVGTTQQACLDWSIQHEMWHAGQLAMLRKALGHSSVFGGDKG